MSDPLIRALFICSQNKLRSPTAERVFSSWPGVETDSAGVLNDATIPLSSEHIEWATRLRRYGPTTDQAAGDKGGKVFVEW